MGDSSFQQRGLYFEEFEVGQSVETVGRTITESDVVTFAGLSGDYNQIHTDAAYAADYLFGERVAHGLLILSVVSGLAVRTGVIEGTVLAFREVASWKFSKPVFLGDTVRARLEITEKKEMRRLGGGSVRMKVSVLNQKDEVVQRGEWVMLVASQPS